MRYNGNNLKEVLEAHETFLDFIKGCSVGFSPEATVEFKGMTVRVSELIADFSFCLVCAEDLQEKDLSYANFNFSLIRNTNLRNTTLKYASFYNTYIRESCLENANLTFANLVYAHICDTSINGANFLNACLTNIYIDKIQSVNKVYNFHIPFVCPSAGSFIGWKKCITESLKQVIVKLLIPESAKRLSGTGRKCRCDRAMVLEIQNIDGSMYNGKAYSLYTDSDFEYTVGKTVVPEEPFDDNRWNECSSGIHFFITREEAVDY